MNFLFSFLFSLFITFTLLGGIFFVFFYKKPQKKVYVHTAVIALKKSSVNRVKKKASLEKSYTKVSKSQENKKESSKKSLSRGGDIKLNDIFKNVNYNVKTEKVNLAKQEVRRFKALEDKLKAISLSEVNFKLANENISNNKIEDKVLLKLQSIWNKISSRAGEYAKIRVTVQNSNVKVFVIKSNLSKYKENLLVQAIENEDFNENFSLIVTFRTKVNK